MNRTIFAFIIGGSFICVGMLLAWKDWLLGCVLGMLTVVILLLGRE